ncbi:hypothetical protein WJX72_012339 [[Myrmecia] bisecta]|uniref:CENP-V/GFA domain-containing protein n=1 Tax=[Myrmecia] bisecta TaxID=41462 RepID=A0AAW1Q925_9CHLO
MSKRSEGGMQAEAKREHSGRCACGGVQIGFTADPTFQLYCHCRSCQLHSATRVWETIGWVVAPPQSWEELKFDGIEVAEGRNLLRNHQTSGTGHTCNRYFCGTCGTRMLITVPGDNIVGLPAVLFPSFDFAPQLHMFCGAAAGDKMKMLMPFADDGLPKFVDSPKDFGGTGEVLDLKAAAITDTGIADQIAEVALQDEEACCSL